MPSQAGLLSNNAEKEAQPVGLDWMGPENSRDKPRTGNLSQLCPCPIAHQPYVQHLDPGCKVLTYHTDII